MANTTYTDLFCSMQVQNPHTRATMTVGGDDGMGDNSPNDAAIGVTSYTTNAGMKDAAPMNYPRWYPTGTTTSEGDIVVQGGSMRGGPNGPGVLTPEIYRPDTGVRLEAAHRRQERDGVRQRKRRPGRPVENRWWYPRAFVAPGSGNIFNIKRHADVRARPEAADGGDDRPRGRVPAATSATRAPTATRWVRPPRPPCTDRARSCRSAGARGPTAAGRPARAPASPST